MAGTQALDRATSLLRLVVEAQDTLSHTDLVAETGLPGPTVSRVMRALEDGGLVERDHSGAYRGGELFARYAERFDHVGAMVAMANPFLEDVADATGETINLAVPRGDDVVHVAQIDADFVVGAINWLNVDVPGHCSSLGKVLYAWGTVRLPRGHLEIRTEHTIRTRAALERDLAGVRTRGYAVTRSELEEGLVALAAPVRDSAGQVIAAMSVSGPEFRIGGQVEEIATRLVRDADRLSAAIRRRSRA
ncbi:IclR family transcriptional regulator [Aeromicrobium sp.]|uniref:IclR family transcriptional regulator n=1 Tax=Aeromicrobium sp. TaxID=1871063 RepID=UPI0025C66231|nr:IclR family transcriptional regulator [Aeromicrobium sp.]